MDLEVLARELSQKFQDPSRAVVPLDSIGYVAESQDEGYGFTPAVAAEHMRNAANAARKFKGEDQITFLKLFMETYNRAAQRLSSPMSQLSRSQYQADKDPTAAVEKQIAGHMVSIPLIRDIVEKTLMGDPKNDRSTIYQHSTRRKR